LAFADDPIVVHAVSYPPFVVNSEQSKGITGDALIQFMSGFGIEVVFDILPPARIEIALADKNYLASLVPPPTNSPNVYRFETGEQYVHLRLFRLRTTPKPIWPPDPTTSIVTLGFVFKEGPLSDFEALGGRIERAPTIRSALLMLLNERVDYMLSVDSAVFEAADLLEISDKIVASEDYYQKFSTVNMWVNRDHPQADDLIHLLESTKE
jgi:hypothetical protein